ncbi:MAG: ArnT family glycosyltransferase, partial [Candidatus Paceibacterota bacterium]
MFLIVSALFIVTGLIFRAYQLRMVPFYDWDEAIYAQVAREILQNGNLTTSFNGELWLNKPPLSHGLIASAFRIFGESELVARLLMVVFAVLFLYLLYALSKKILHHFFASVVNNLSFHEKSVVYLLPVLTASSTSLFLQRSTLLNTDIMIALAWMGYFLWRPSYTARLFFLIFGVMTKSLLGFYPLAFELLLLKRKSFTQRGLVRGAGLIIIPLAWHIVSFIRFGEFFVTAHLLDQFIKRVSTPIELHFGGRLFYPLLAWENFGILLLIVAAGYAAVLADITQFSKNKFTFSRYISRAKKLMLSNDWQYYVILLAGLPFFIFLTFIQSKISWYFTAIIPLFALVVPYLYVKVDKKIFRVVLASVVVAFFLYRFIPETYMLHPDTTPSPKLQVAECVSTLPGERIAFLV